MFSTFNSPTTAMSRIQEDLITSSHPQNTKDSDPDMLRRSLAAGRQLQACVVGAGVAGLRAADVLLSHGAHVTILEARDRVGGRVSFRDVFQSIAAET